MAKTTLPLKMSGETSFPSMSLKGGRVARDMVRSGEESKYLKWGGGGGVS